MHAISPAFAVAVIGYCAAIFLLSSSSDPVPHEELFAGEDKVAHFVLYAGLAFLLSTGLRRAPQPLSVRLQLLVPIVFVACYGVSDELHQLFVPGRSCDIFDLLADTAGGFVTQAWMFRRRPLLS